MSEGPRYAAGRYKVRAVRAEAATASTGTDQVIVEFQFLEGDYVNETTRWYAAYTDKTEKFVTKGLMLCGWDGESDDFAGVDRNEVEIDIEVSTYNGKTTSKVKWIVDPDRDTSLAGEKAMPAEKRAGFMQRMKNRAASISVGATAKKEDDSFDINTL